jgi:hypothetical protein
MGFCAHFLFYKKRKRLVVFSEGFAKLRRATIRDIQKFNNYPSLICRGLATGCNINRKLLILRNNSIESFLNKKLS